MALLISDLRTVVINGTKVLVRDGTATVTFGGPVRTAQFSGQRVAGHTETAASSELSLTLSLEKGQKVRNTFIVRGAEIRLITDTGDEWLMRDAANTDTPSFAGGDGAVTVSYSGQPIEEL